MRNKKKKKIVRSQNTKKKLILQNTCLRRFIALGTFSHNLVILF